MPKKESGMPEIEELMPEEEERRRPGEPINLWELFFKATGVIVTLAAVVWGVVQFGLEHEASRKKQYVDMRAPLRKRQMDTYMEACDCAARFAWLDVKDRNRKLAYDRFMILYSGQLCVVEAKEVEKTSTEFRAFALQCNENVTIQQQFRLMDLSRKLAIACRRELADTWGVDLETLPTRHSAGG